jgi:glycosyltransferase involved in cell wall biosynthesis
VPSRLGIYVDGPYRVVETPDGPRVAPDPADFPFLTFACTVGADFDSTVVFGRATDSEEAETTELLLPPGVTMAALPPYESLHRIGQVAGAATGTMRGFWRGLSRVDAVWVFGPHPFSFILVACALLRRKDVVLGVRQDTKAYYRQRLPSARWRPTLLGALGLDIGYRAMSRLVRTTTVGEDLARHYGGRRPTLLPISVSLVGNAEVVDRPVDRDWSGPIELLTVGRIEQEKNPLLLVDVLASLERERPGRYHLTWAGTGPLSHAVLQYARELGVDDQLELLGFVPFGSDLLTRYRTAHMFVHASLTEGMPAVLIEALASGTSVVATDVGGVSAVLKHGAAGLLVPPRDVDSFVRAIIRLSDDAQLRESLVAQGLSIARSMTVDSQAHRIASFIRGDAEASDPAG